MGDIQYTGVGIHFLQRATLKTLLLSGAAYIMSTLLQLQFTTNKNVMIIYITMYCCFNAYST